MVLFHRTSHADEILAIRVDSIRVLLAFAGGRASRRGRRLDERTRYAVRACRALSDEDQLFVFEDGLVVHRNEVGIHFS